MHVRIGGLLLPQWIALLHCVTLLGDSLGSARNSAPAACGIIRTISGAALVPPFTLAATVLPWFPRCMQLCRRMRVDHNCMLSLRSKAGSRSSALGTSQSALLLVRSEEHTSELQSP